jgi:Ran GTPase-activating protein (RanGAP) involved in mRNA processing and transport
MVAGVNKVGEQAKKDKNAQVQMMKKIRTNHFSVVKVVLRDDPVVKTAEDLFGALAKNTNIESINLKNVKLSNKAVELLGEALKVNSKLHTIIINGVVPSDPFISVIKVQTKRTVMLFRNGLTMEQQALESSNTTLHTLHVFQGPNKFFESAVEKMFKGTNKRSCFVFVVCCLFS